MHGFVIEHRPCPHCLNLRTVRYGDAAFCFNCRSHLGAAAPEPLISYPFTLGELARLNMYCDAVRAEFYTDADV